MKAPAGEYLITLKVKNVAGHETQALTLVDVTMLNALLPLPTFAPPSAPSADSTEEEEKVTTVALSGKSSARYSNLTAPLSLLALLSASGALVAEGKQSEFRLTAFFLPSTNFRLPCIIRRVKGDDGNE